MKNQYQQTLTHIFGYCIALIFLSTASFAQSSQKFFKCIPSSIEIEKAPNWAKLMYAEDPSVPDVMDAYKKYYKENKFVKTLHTQNYKYWTRETYKHLDLKGKVRPKSQEELEEHFKVLRKRKKDMEKGLANKSSQSSTWQCIGPFETYLLETTTPVSIQANVYSIDQSVSNPNLVICGTEHGGVYKSTNKGISWNPISENEDFCNVVTAVAIRPDNNNVFFAGADKKLYKTTNAGGGWTELLNAVGEIHEIKFDPSNNDHMFLAAGSGLWESFNGGSSWNQVYYDEIYDIDYHPTNSNYVYLLRANSGDRNANFLRSTNNGGSWSVMTNGWYNPEVYSQAGFYGGKIGVSPDNPNRVYAALIGDSKAGDDGWIGVYRSDNGGANWQLPSGQIGGPYNDCNTMPWNAAAYCGSDLHQGFYNFDFEVSPNDADKFWLGTIRLSESTDGGVTYQAIGANGTVRLENIHADIQAIHTSGNDIWVATDGGIDYSNDDLQTAESRKKGIAASSYWGFGAGWNEDVLVGGRYHNGNSAYYQTYGVGNSYKVSGVEEATGYVNPMENTKAYFGYGSETHRTSIPISLTGPKTELGKMSLRPNESYTPLHSSGLYSHPYYAEHMILGKDAKIWKTEDDGENWEMMHDFGNAYVLEMAYARDNPLVIYAVVQSGSSFWDSCQLWKSVNGGSTWNLTSTVPTNNSFRLQITVNPENSNEIWVASRDGGNGSKVFRSTNGGVFWTNMTSSVLDLQKIVDIAYHGGSNGLVYLLTDTNFFYYYPDTNTWIQYDMGLPLIHNGKWDMSLFYRDQKIRIATEGRGIWEVDFPYNYNTVVTPITERKTVNCFDDIVQFDSHSIIDQRGAITWEWNFNPSPTWIDNPNIRNPKVIFGSTGYYDVSLKVTSGGSNVEMLTVPDMVFVDANCMCRPCTNCSGSYEYLANASLIDTCCIELTENTTWTKGGIWHPEKISLNNSFEMKFDVDIGQIDGTVTVADGVAFVLQKQGFNALGTGGGIGENGIAPSLAVAMRTYYLDRVEVIPNGLGCCDNYIPGSNFPISGSGFHPVTINWDASSKQLSIDWNDDGLDATINYDITSNIFSGNPNNVIWGFIGGTGGYSANHKVCNIRLNGQACPVSYSQANGTRLTGLQATSMDFETNGFIESEEQIDFGNNVDYDAANYIKLFEDFEVKSGASFQIYIDGCGGLYRKE